MRKKLPLLTDLFFTFLKIGLFTFGGGYAMISVIEDTCVDRKRWITHEEMMDMTVIAESTPGPIAINCATYVGMQEAGLLGAAVATLGVVLPSFVLIFVIAQYLDNFLEYALIAKAFQGVRVGVSLLILRVGVDMVKKMKKKPLPLAIMMCAFGTMLVIDWLALDFSTIGLMLCAGAASLCVFTWRGGAKA